MRGSGLFEARGLVTSRRFLSVVGLLAVTVALYLASFSPVHGATHQLFVSPNPDRSGHQALDGQTVSGDIYVFIGPETDVSRVDFFLDDPEMSGDPIQSEELAPYDFAGTALDGNASPFSTLQIEDGEHAITAVATLTDGSHKTVTATFSVNNGDTPLDILVSQSPDRSQPRPLHGEEVSGDVHIFTNLTSGAGQVEFYLDDEDMSGAPFQTEQSAPYDFAGTAADGGAEPFSTMLLANGEHSVTAVIDLYGGGQEILTSMFRVENEGSLFDILMSSNSDRSNEVALDGQTVSDEIYVFIDPSGGVGRVEFYLDDPDMSGAPVQTEQFAPYDFAGTALDGASLPFRTQGVSNGEHTITAAITLTEGERRVVIAAFEVDNGDTSVDLLVSTNPDRSNPEPVEGETVSGDIHVFAEPIAGLRYVQFFLDDVDMTGDPHQVEQWEPYDFNGTAEDGSAIPFATQDLSNGEHTISARLHLQDREPLEIHAPFEVADNPASVDLEVNSTAADSDGKCEPLPEGDCTLTEAIDAANADADPDVITFDIPADADPGCDAATGVCTIAGTPPQIREQVVIDGYTQPGASENTSPISEGLNTVLKIAVPGRISVWSDGSPVVRGLVMSQLDVEGGASVIGNFIGTDVTGTASAGGSGLRLDHNPTTLVEGNLISGNIGHGVDIPTGSATLRRNLIGTDITGSYAVPNGGDGIRVDSENIFDVMIGGSAPSHANVISGNVSDGVEVDDVAQRAVEIQGNLVGTDAAGMSAIPNGGHGVYFSGSGGAGGLIVGGSEPGEGNLLSGNTLSGFATNSGPFVMHGNLVGTDSTGDAALPNGSHGVLLSINTANGEIGGIAPSEANVIAFNGGDGVRVDDGDATRNTIRGNSIHSNAGDGIANVDGGNTELPAPVITGTDPVSGTACADCVIDVYSDDEDEGRVYEGFAVANASGNWTFAADSTGPNITATATDADGNTSEFGSF